MEKVNFKELKRQVFEIDSQFGELACIAETFVGARELLSDLNEDIRGFSFPDSERFQLKIQAILNLLTYANENLGEIDQTIIEMHKNIVENVMGLT